MEWALRKVSPARSTHRHFLRVVEVFIVAVVTSSLQNVVDARSLTQDGVDARSLSQDGADASKLLSRHSRATLDALDYLEEFGYISDISGALRSQDEIRDALKRFQGLARIPKTGEMDSETRDAMARPRCGMKDSRSATSGGPQNYELGPSKWMKTDLTYKFVTSRPTRHLGLSSVKEATRQAFALWADVSPLSFREVYTDNADILVSFDRLDHGDGFSFDGPGKVLAHAFNPGEGRGGDVHFDDDEQWTVNIAAGTNLFTVAAHEFGHSLGISHSGIQGALMYPFYAGFNPKLQLHTDDIAAIHQLYGPKPRVTVRPTVVTNRAPPVYTMRSAVAQRTNPPTTRRITAIPFTTRAPTTRAPTTRAPAPPQSCDHIDAISVIRGEVFAFKGKWFWRMNSRGVITAYPIPISDFWIGYPSHLPRVDAAFQRPDNNRTIFFQANRYYEFDENRLAREFPAGGRPLTDFGLPLWVQRVDAALAWGKDQRVYLFSGHSFWRLGTRLGLGGQPTAERGYPQVSQNVWKGIVFPVDSAFTHKNGLTYFLKGADYWQLDDSRSSVAVGFPQPIIKLWPHCPLNMLTVPADSAERLSASMLIALLAFSFTRCRIVQRLS